MGKMRYRKVAPISFSNLKRVDQMMEAQENKVKELQKEELANQQYLKDEFMKSVESAGRGNFEEVSLTITRG